ncbi:uncharacterized protein BJX67DRAFT_121420 [Aspergillus lucknowensis]|uniref:Uncharacterized protein n=1 Tax=Aspergillus lucknowensis TaxID=176173 RepID=A0ABR4LQ48_9EURO
MNVSVVLVSDELPVMSAMGSHDGGESLWSRNFEDFRPPGLGRVSRRPLQLCYQLFNHRHGWMWLCLAIFCCMSAVFDFGAGQAGRLALLVDRHAETFVPFFDCPCTRVVVTVLAIFRVRASAGGSMSGRRGILGRYCLWAS